MGCNFYAAQTMPIKTPNNNRNNYRKLLLTFYKSYDWHWINQEQGWSGYGLSVSFSMKGIGLIFDYSIKY